MFIRSANNPILKPNPKNSWESQKVYNCGAIYEGGKYHLFYRAVGEDWISRIGYAVSTDGEKFNRSDKPMFEPTGSGDRQGVEDPRLTKINSKYYLTYSAYDGEGAACDLQLAISEDLENWERKGPMVADWNLDKAQGFLISRDPAQTSAVKAGTGNQWIKAGGIFSEVIDGKYWMVFGDRHLWLAFSKDGLEWEAALKPFIKPRPRMFDSEYIEMGPPPIKTDIGWLILYHGINSKVEYQIGFIILDLDNPRKILYRSDQPIFSPQESYELAGLVDILPGGFKAMEKMSENELSAFIKEAEDKSIMPKVVFSCGAAVVDGILRIYYGASDSVICTATARLADILAEANNN